MPDNFLNYHHSYPVLRSERIHFFKISVISIIASLLLTGITFAQTKNYFQLKVYKIDNAEQSERINNYLKNALVPALHRNGIKTVGVFYTIPSDTILSDYYLFIPFRSLEDLTNIENKLKSDNIYQESGKEFINSQWDNPPYNRINNIILKGFPKAPGITKPNLTAIPSNRVYELRSYEGPTEKYYQSKLKMFNVGDEISIFNRLNFNAIFYGHVVAGDRIPNLMYMTTFNSMQDREEHWKKFFADPKFVSLKGMSEYDHSITKVDITFLRPADYSDL